MKTLSGFAFLQLILFVVMSESQRPLLHSRIARTMYDKMLNDDNLKNIDYSKFYQIDEEKLNLESKEKFIQLTIDKETREFLSICIEQSDSVLLQFWHALVKSLLSLMMSQTSVNGLLNRGRMFVWSRKQAQILLDDPKEAYGRNQGLVQLDHRDQPPLEGSSPCSTSLRVSSVAAESCEVFLDASDIPQDCSSGTPPDNLWWTDKLILDLGAGDGHVTRILGKAAKEVYVTETSSFMRHRLQQKGYKVLNAETWVKEGPELYDLVTCLNLLDRCDKPKQLLHEIHQKLSPDGKLVVALVLPFSPYVESNSNHQPTEHLNVDGTVIEEQINHFIKYIFPSLGFYVEKWTKLPYFCEGDMNQSFYWLLDTVFVLKRIS